jgi:TusA-related sulfurtransferase
VKLTGDRSVELDDLGFDAGAHVLVALALAPLPAGSPLLVAGRHPELSGQLAAWCRVQGHRVLAAHHDDGVTSAVVERGSAVGARWVGAEQAGHDAGIFARGLSGRAAPATPVVRHPPAHWGLAARGAWVEAGGPEPVFALSDGDELWSDRAGDIYRQGLAAQWDPAQAIDWTTPIEHADVVERAVVAVMTYLIENEEAALVIPARFLGQVHPHFREVQQVLALTVADEARHIEVFGRRAQLTGGALGLSSAGGRASLQSLLDEPDFAIASFLLSAMGEGTFVSLLGFLERHAPDPLTRRIAQLTRSDEARHVAFALGHLERHVTLHPRARHDLAAAVQRRHHALRSTAGLNDDVFDALVLLAAGDPTPAAIRQGWNAVQALQRDMDEGRRARLARLGFSPGEAETLSSLHTRNFM